MSDPVRISSRARLACERAPSSDPSTLRTVRAAGRRPSPRSAVGYNRRSGLYGWTICLLPGRGPAGPVWRGEHHSSAVSHVICSVVIRRLRSLPASRSSGRHACAQGRQGVELGSQWPKSRRTSASSPSARIRSVTNRSTRTSSRSPGTASIAFTAACHRPSRSTPMLDTPQWPEAASARFRWQCGSQRRKGSPNTGRAAAAP